MAVDQTADVIKDVKDNEVDSLRRVFHALKIEPCRLRLVSSSLVINGKNKPATVILRANSRQTQTTTDTVSDSKGHL